MPSPKSRLVRNIAFIESSIGKRPFFFSPLSYGRSYAALMRQNAKLKKKLTQKKLQLNALRRKKT
jgi:hypothetical protein